MQVEIVGREDKGVAFSVGDGERIVLVERGGGLRLGRRRVGRRVGRIGIAGEQNRSPRERGLRRIGLGGRRLRSLLRRGILLRRGRGRLGAKQIQRGGFEGKRQEGGGQAAKSHEPNPLRGFAGPEGVTGGGAGWRRWRMASSMTTAPATETLSEGNGAGLGVGSRWAPGLRT